ncbi:hypothetical protein JW890_08995, partial [candidate division WOR-3 bacterium]|nr:hypothetical protein [candidate division WOR-3 bacterium]
FSLAQFTLGLFSMGQFAVGICLAIGQAALGFATVATSGTGYYKVVKPESFSRGLEMLFSQIASDPVPFISWTAFWLAFFFFFYLQKDKFTGKWKIADFFKPRWKHSSLDFRTKHIKQLKNQNLLYSIAKNDPASIAKTAAVSVISDKSILRSILLDKELKDAHVEAIRKIDDEKILLEIALLSENHAMASELFQKIKTLGYLRKIAREAENNEIRAKAILVSEPDESFLAERASVESDNSVLMSIANKTNRQNTLTGIIKKSSDDNVKTAAAGKLKKEDISSLKELIANENSLSALRKVAVLIEDQDSLKFLSKNSKHPAGRQASIEALNNPSDNFLLEIIGDEKEMTVCKTAIDRIKNENILTDLAMNYPRKAVSVLAVRSITQRNILLDISKNAGDSKVRLEAKSRFDDLKPGYLGLKIEMRCPFCSQPVFVNGLFESVKCRSCLSVISLDLDFWKTVISSPYGITRQLTYHDLIIDKSESLPKCVKCSSQLDVELYPQGKDSFIVCSSCREKNSSFPIPENFNWITDVRQLFCAEKQSDETAVESQTKPISISCVKCGAPLTITVETPRNAVCGYCDTVQYLPDSLWSSLHPARKKRQWFMAYVKTK